jgi:hypothetical protein
MNFNRVSVNGRSWVSDCGRFVVAQMRNTCYRLCRTEGGVMVSALGGLHVSLAAAVKAAEKVCAVDEVARRYQPGISAAFQAGDYAEATRLVDAYRDELAAAGLSD